METNLKFEAAPKNPLPKPFIVYIPKFNKIYEIENTYGINFELAMFLVKLGATEHIEYIGEL